MSFKLDGKAVSKFALKCLSYIVRKIFSIILWFFLIVIFIALAVTQKSWQAAGFALIIAIVYVIRFLRLKLKNEKQQKKESEPSIPATPLN